VTTALRAAAAICLAIVASLGLGLPAAAASTPTPAPTSGTPTFVEYRGNSTESSEQGHVFPGKFPSDIRIDCADGVCVVTKLTILDSEDHAGYIDFSQGRRIVVVDGQATVELPAFGDLCGAYWVGAGVLTLNATPTGFTGIRTSTGSPSKHCSDGSDVSTIPFKFVDHATLFAGNPCVLDSTCPTPKPTATATPHPLAGGPGLDKTPPTHINSRTTLSDLPTAKQALTVHGLLWSAAVTVVLVLLIAFPTHLLNGATGEGQAKLKEWWTKRRPKVVENATRLREVEYRGWPIAAGGVLIASLISSFVDPSFGFNASSVRVFLSILVSFILDAVVGWFLLIYLVRRARPHTTASFHFSPASLVVVLGAVLFTRLTGFAPGIIFGLVAGVAFGTILATAERARVALVGLGYSFVAAVIGWVGYSALAATVGPHPGAWEVFLSETLSSMAIGGIAALPIALVPLRGLTGFDIFSWNRWVWGGAYAIGLLGFFVVLMPLPFAWSGVHVNLVIWITVYIAYALFSVGVWLIFSKPWQKAVAGDKTQSPDSTMVAHASAETPTT
jgi:hypothetical protein